MRIGHWQRIAFTLGVIMFAADAVKADEVTVIAAREITYSRYDDTGKVDDVQCNWTWKDGSGKLLYYYMEGKLYASYSYFLAPESEDYRFGGWFGMANDDADPSIDKCTVLLNSDITGRKIYEAEIAKAKTSSRHSNEHVICAKYERTVTISTAVDQTGTGSAEYWTNDPRYEEDNKTCVGKSARLTARPESGYAFAGWKKGTSWVSYDDMYEFTVGMKSGGTYTASFTGCVYSVTLNKPDAEGGTSEVLVQYKQPMPTPIVLPERYGYTFGGYFSQRDGAGKQYYTADGQSANDWDRSKGATLYAYWIPKMGNLTLKFNVGVSKIYYRIGESSQWITNVADTVISLQVGTWIHAYGIAVGGYAIADYDIENQWIQQISVDGQTFSPTARAVTPKYIVSFVDPTGLNETVQQEIEKGSGALAPEWSRVGYGLGWDKDFSSITGNATITAVWTANRYVIHFEANGGSGTMNDLSAAYDEQVSLPPNAFAKGIQTFLHWTATVDNVAMRLEDRCSVSNLTAVALGTNTLFAVWGEDYLVGFDGNGAVSGQMENQHYVRDERKSLSANMYERTGYSFVGWDDLEAIPNVRYTNCAEVVNLAAIGTTNTLRAAWSNNPYRVTYDMGGVEIVGSVPSDSSCLYDYAWNLPAAPVPQFAEYVFEGWSTDDGKLSKAKAGGSASNLTATADGVVTVRAEWSVDYGNLSRALGGNVLKLKFECDDETTWSGWYCGEKQPAEESPSATYVGKHDEDDGQLRAETVASGELRFRWKGNGVTLWVYLKYHELGDPIYKFDSDDDSWRTVRLSINRDLTKEEVPQIVFKTDASDGWPIMIADMTWTSEAHPEPTEDDAVTIGTASVADGKFKLSFASDARFDYNLLTNADLTVDSWGVMQSESGTGEEIVFEPTIDASQPQLFYKVETIQKRD